MSAAPGSFAADQHPEERTLSPQRARYPLYIDYERRVLENDALNPSRSGSGRWHAALLLRRQSGAADEARARLLARPDRHSAGGGGRWTSGSLACGS
jgi:hypothetical protein